MIIKFTQEQIKTLCRIVDAEMDKTETPFLDKEIADKIIDVVYNDNVEIEVENK